MNFLSDIPAAITAIDRFLMLHGRDFDDAAQGALLQASASPSPVDKIVGVGEVIYAMGATATDDARTLAAGLVEFASRYSWHGLATDGRGAGMVAALRRDLGEDAPLSGWPAADTDPAPRADLVAALGLSASNTVAAI
jgi:hypothetical protein